MTHHRDPNSIAKSAEDSRLVYATLQADRAGFMRMAQLLREQTGINLPENQKNLALMASRLLSTMRACGCESYGQYLAWLSRAGQPGILEFVQCMTTNTTEFFREPAHFDVLRRILSGRMSGQSNQEALAKQREIRIWCAASSSGQEPYTILMNVMDELERQLEFPDIKFLASDIDHSMLEQASSGVYSKAEIRSLPQEFQQRWFRPLIKNSDDAHRYVADKSLRDAITFAQLNLINFPYPFQHGFDIVFCRNVLIYFDRNTSQKVVTEIARHIKPGGFLFLGHSEAGVMRPENLKPVADAVYRKDP